MRTIQRFNILSLFLALVLVVIVVKTPGLYAFTDTDTESRTTDPAVEYLADLRGISFTEAEERVNWFDKADALNSELTDHNIKGFGGVWINPVTDRVEVGIASNEDNVDTRDEVSQYIKSYDLSEAVDYVSVQNSFQKLLATRQAIIKDFDNSLPKQSAGYAVGIVTDQNKVLVHHPRVDSSMEVTTKDMLQKIIDSYPSIVKTETSEGKFTPLACNWWFCGSPLRGGVGIKGYPSSSSGADNTIDCTAGFGVRGNTGAKYILTAGHCQTYGEYDSYWRTSDYSYNNKNIGDVHRNVLAEGTKIDGMIIETSDIGSWSAAGKVYVRSGIGLGGFSGPDTNEDYDITDYGTSSGLINDRVCTSGARSADLDHYEGGSCGPVKEVLLYEPDIGVGPLDGLVRAYLCARSGDSGAPVFRSGKALGIISGTLSSTGCNSQIVYTGLQPIINAFNGTIDVY